MTAAGATAPAGRGEQPGESSVPEGAGPPAAASSPRGPARSSVLGVVWAACLLGLAVVAGHDTLAYAGVLSGEPWLERAVSGVDGTGPESWWVPVAIAAIVVGLALVLLALQPRPRLGRAVQAHTGVFLLDRGLRRLAASTAEDVDGVGAASASVRRGSVTVHVHAVVGHGGDDLDRRVTEVVEQRLARLEDPPRVRVRDRARS